MVKRLRSNYAGIITFIEDSPINPLNQNQLEAVIIDIEVLPEISDNLDRIIISFELEPAFYLNAENEVPDRPFIMDMKYDQQISKHYCHLDHVKCNCELFKNGNSIHMLGYMFPDEGRGLRKFYFVGKFN